MTQFDILRLTKKYKGISVFTLTPIPYTVHGHDPRTLGEDWIRHKTIATKQQDDWGQQR